MQTSGNSNTATVYKDAPDADADSNPQAYVITSEEVDSSTSMTVHMARGGGFAIAVNEN